MYFISLEPKDGLCNPHTQVKTLFYLSCHHRADDSVGAKSRHFSSFIPNNWSLTLQLERNMYLGISSAIGNLPVDKRPANSRPVLYVSLLNPLVFPY